MGAPRTGSWGPTLRAVEMDGELLSRVRTGDEGAFVMLVARYQQPMLRLACSMVSNQAVAEEVVQDTWLGVVRGIEQFEGRVFVQDLAVSDPRQPGALGQCPGAIYLLDRDRSEQSTRPASTLRANGPIPSTAGQKRARTVSTPPAGCRFSRPLSRSYLPVSARWSCCETSRGFHTMTPAPCSGSASATSGSCSTGDGRGCERSSTPSCRRADRVITATERHCLPASGRACDRLPRRRSVPPGPTSLRGSSQGVPQLCGLPGADQDDHPVGRRDRARGLDT